MTNITGGVTHANLPQSGQNRLGNEQSQSGGRSFEDVLRGGSGAEQAGQTGQAGQTAAMGLDQPSQVSGAKLEQMRLELTQRLDRIPPGGSKISALLPEFLDTKTRLGLLRDAMATKRPGAGTPGGMDLQGRFGQVENEWKQIEGIMRSDKNLSTGELLGLQARLYQVSQHIEVMSKVVDQVTGGVKTILNTNV